MKDEYKILAELIEKAKLDGLAERTLYAAGGKLYIEENLDLIFMHHLVNGKQPVELTTSQASDLIRKDVI